VEALLIALVSVLATALVGAGVIALQARKRLTRDEHDEICEPRIRLLQKDIKTLQIGQDDAKAEMKGLRADVLRILEHLLKEK
jgi:hypothetical protein